MNLVHLLTQAKEAARHLRSSPPQSKNAVLSSLADKLKTDEARILAGNALDLKALPESAAAAFRDRLTLNSKRLAAMQESLRQVEALPDPVGEVAETQTLSNGLLIKRTRSPLGLIFMIFESRPNVAVEAFSLAFKSGNGLILRGGKESRHTVEVLYALMQESLKEHGFPEATLTGITDPDRSLVLELLQAKKFIDVVVPRGGDKLIEFVVENSKIPIIKNDRGLCHIYVHSDADLSIAARVVENAKKQRPGVCNSMETLLVHESIAAEFLPALSDLLSKEPHPVEWFGCEQTNALLKGKAGVHAATELNFNTEYLDYKMNCKVVQNLDEAIAHIEKHGSRHSESILTRDEPTARQFQMEVDAAAVYWNASTRFTDGFELGLGGELGISTQKLHVRGPVGLRELTSLRWVIDGSGQVRN